MQKMDKDIFSLNNNMLQGVINDLQQIINTCQDNQTINKIGDLLIKMNLIINENRKNMEAIMNQISFLQNKINQINQNMNINNIINQQELKGKDWRYFGQVINGKREGKGIIYYNDGDRYEGEFKNGKKDGKGIYYYNEEPFKDDRYEGDFRDGKLEGKGMSYYHNGDKYEGDFKNN